jgi:hypothetical protein
MTIIIIVITIIIIVSIIIVSIIIIIIIIIIPELTAAWSMMSLRTWVCGTHSISPSVELIGSTCHTGGDTRQTEAKRERETDSRAITHSPRHASDRSKTRTGDRTLWHV